MLRELSGRIVQIFSSINTHSCQGQNVSHGGILWVDVKILLLLHGYFKISVIIEWMLNGQNSSFSTCEEMRALLLNY